MNDYTFPGFVEFARRLAEINSITREEALEALSLLADDEWRQPHDSQGRVLVTLKDGRTLSLTWPEDP